MNRASLNTSYKKPIVGVLISRSNVSKLMRQEFHLKYTHMARANKIAGITLYFFSPRDINYADKTIAGLYFDYQDEMWKQKSFLFPNIVYNRGYRGSLNVTKAINTFQTNGVLLINTLSGFNKWDVYQSLAKKKELQPFLPTTRFFKKAQDITTKDFETFLKKRTKLYIKATRGSRGRKVVSIEKKQNGYECSFFINTLTIIQVNKTSEIIDILKEFFGESNIIIQDAIDLVKIDNRIIDLRAEVQRNGKGEIEVAAIPVRIGQQFSPISTHGDSFPFNDFFKVILSNSEKEINMIRNKIEDILVQLYTSIEEEYGPFGEIEIDLGLDRNGQLWFIECNAFSAKKSFIKAYDEKTITRSFLNLLEYAKFIYFKGN
ncbi:YheC/YheD family protein [Alkalihalobacillus sp. MEB130]|uniref:YheC/YheD family endospore coat-associated protein n=1 Tax=Alkalihalobacillus sp. MEB130 TaxID=2976704 RepID=UPI0028DD94BB|nr:YheC/YheD family protein [Alkalihalobacillus sp. MEB130]MDT8861217.1 YheC/YheD family protein [Alkalihalobacillus sp. MEB130]